MPRLISSRPSASAGAARTRSAHFVVLPASMPTLAKASSMEGDASFRSTSVGACRVSAMTAWHWSGIRSTCGTCAAGAPTRQSMSADKWIAWLRGQRYAARYAMAQRHRSRNLVAFVRRETRRSPLRSAPPSAKSRKGPASPPST